jgi:hypothetical protein
MRSVVRLGAAAAVTLALGGCGSGSIKPGMPAGVNMTKDYTPKVDMPKMSPKIEAEAKAKARDKAAKSARKR